MRKYKIDELEIFSHFEPRNWFKRNEVNFAIAGIIFAVCALLTVSILNYIIL